MKILLTPNALKGSLTAADFVQIAKKVLSKHHHIQSVCLSDGGDGFLDFFKTLYPNSRTKYCLTKDALLRDKRVPFLLLADGKTAVIETAKICGLGNLSKKELNIERASSYGLGQVLLKARKLGVKKIYVGLGGVACNDGGAGLVQACTGILTNKNGAALLQGTKPLLELAHLNLSSLQKLFKQIQIIGVSDVKNTLLGPRSSAKVFGPQKGASPAQVKMIDKAMCKWAQAIQKTTGRKISHQPGTAAAGAIAAGLAGCFGAELISGSQFLIQKTHVEKSIQQADLIITSEGKLDRQTFYGKAPLAILKLAKKYRKKVLFICGQLEEKSLRNEPLAPTQVAVLTDFALSAQDAQENAAKYVRRVLKNI